MAPSTHSVYSDFAIQSVLITTCIHIHLTSSLRGTKMIECSSAKDGRKKAYLRLGVNGFLGIRHVEKKWGYEKSSEPILLSESDQRPRIHRSTRLTI
jgi:hypothetical protein